VSQLALSDGLALESCKERGCTRPVVGSSTTGKGHVCKGHNEAEWGQALRTYDPPLSSALIRASARTLRPTPQSEED
jgi:hypothetical protein